MSVRCDLCGVIVRCGVDSDDGGEPTPKRVAISVEGDDRPFMEYDFCGLCLHDWSVYIEDFTNKCECMTRRHQERAGRLLPACSGCFAGVESPHLTNCSTGIVGLYSPEEESAAGAASVKGSAG
jgi:hypothetical protein